MNKSERLINKYNVQGPRYTSYPTVPFWKTESFSLEKWKTSVQRSFQENNQDGISIYIHLPFCESLCTFCGCHKHITKQHSVEESYIDAVIREWQLYLKLFEKKPLIKELHLGGGTPTFFSSENLHYLITHVCQNTTIDSQSEFSFEGHPNNTSEQHLKTLYDLGFRRVSFGIQDYDTVVQKAIHRIQPFEKVKTVHEIANRIGYTSISHDLIFGLPHQTQENFLQTIHLTNTLKPDRISLYSYAHVPWIKGVGQRGFRDEDLPSASEKRKIYESAKKELYNNGYYEVGMDHFALTSDSLYNAFENKKLHRNFMGYTTNNTKLLIGLGVSAISDSWYGYAQNEKTVADYIRIVDTGKIPVFRGHLLTQRELIVRQHILNLICHFKTDVYNTEDIAEILHKLEPLIRDGMLLIENNSIQVTETGKVFIRNICMCFDEYLVDSNHTNLFSKTV